AIAGHADQQRLLSRIARDEKADAKDRVRAIAVLHALPRRAPHAPPPTPEAPRARFVVTHDPEPDAPAANPKNPKNLH
ncbi:MAG: hypothetical protein K1X94_28505, partial [Sandaracinaceae bacterium]|nr:hypothetical protein [Sandaracinaceae bacterium]